MAKPPATSSIKTCFVISPIGANDSATRKKSDKVLKYLVEYVAVPLGYVVERADKLGEPGIITNQIIKRIVDCDILIADLSEHNPNVFYELAIRHGLKKPFIHLISSTEKIPFDNAQMRAISFDLADLDSVEEARNELRAQIQAIEGGKSIAESPISIAFDLETLKSSGKPDDAILALVLEEMSSLRREVRTAQRSRMAASQFRSDKEFAKLPSNYEELISLLRNSEDDKASSISTYMLDHLSNISYNPPFISAIIDTPHGADLARDLTEILKQKTDGLGESISPLSRRSTDIYARVMRRIPSERAQTEH